jgi:hypothetical protein
MSQSKVLRQFLGLIDDSTSHSLMKELFKRRRDEHYERLELEASSAQAREAQTIQENSLWIEKNPQQQHQQQQQSSSGEGSSFSSHPAFVDSPLSQLTDSVSSMAMYLENKIGYPHLKKAINPFKEEEDTEATPQRGDPLATLGDRFSDDEEDEEEEDEDEDMIWLGTGDPRDSEEGPLTQQQQQQQEGDVVSSRSPEKRSSYRDRISHNIKRRTQYRESILLQFSGLDGEDCQEEDSGEDSSSSSGTTAKFSQRSQSPPRSPSHASLLPSTSPPRSSVLKHLWESLMSLLQRISSSSSSESLTQSIEIVPIAILAVVVYFVSSGIGSEINSGEKSVSEG